MGTSSFVFVALASSIWLRVEAEIFAGNPSSGKLLEKFGAKIEGIRRQANRSKADKKIKDAVIYGLLKEEYIKN